MADPAPSDELGAVPPPAGCTWLCWTLTGLGLAMTTAATAFTFHLLHEPMEAVGAAVVDHIASAHCTALTRVLTGLSITSQDSLLGEQGGHRTEADGESVFGVLNPSSGTLEHLRSTSLTPEQVQAVLRGLPTAAAAAPAAVADAVPEDHRCPGFGYGLSPAAVRIQSIPAPLGSVSHGHHHGHPHGGAQAAPKGAQAGGAAGAQPPGQNWKAFLYSPPRGSGQQTVAFALVDLQALTEKIGGHDHDLEPFDAQHNPSLHLQISTYPFAVLRKHDSLQGTLVELLKANNQLYKIRLIPFANQVLGSRIWVDHDIITKTSTRAAGTVFLFGLVATGAVVLVSRSAQIKLERLNQQLASESRTDSLTRVANRRAWDEALAVAESRRIRHGERYGLVVIDLDGFKQINDQQGHHCGDAVLQTTAQQLREELRAADLLARVGGDEFALLLHRPEPDGMGELTRRLKSRLNQAGIEASIGYAICGADRSIEESWSQADQAMYLEKQL